MSFPFTYEQVKSYIENYDYKLLSSEYHRNSEKLEMKCPNGHTCWISFSNFKRGKRCKTCSRLSGNKKKRTSYEYVVSFIEYYDYRLMTPKENYSTTSGEINLICPKGHEFKSTFNRFKSGHRCPMCAVEKRKIQQKLTYEDVKSYIEDNDYRLLSKYYQNAHQKLKLICPKGHEIDITWNDFKNGCGCVYCYRENQRLKLRDSYEYIKSYIESYGFNLLSENHVNSNTRLKIECSEGHVFLRSFSYFKRNGTCPKCSDLISTSWPEIEIGNYVKSLTSEFVELNNRTEIKNPYTGYFLELDVWIPKINKAIEFNGRYWHNKNDDIKKRDDIKKKECERLGVDLLVIEENNWRRDKDTELKKIELFLKE